MESNNVFFDSTPQRESIILSTLNLVLQDSDRDPLTHFEVKESYI